LSGGAKKRSAPSGFGGFQAAWLSLVTNSLPMLSMSRKNGIVCFYGAAHLY